MLLFLPRSNSSPFSATTYIYYRQKRGTEMLHIFKLGSWENRVRKIQIQSVHAIQREPLSSSFLSYVEISQVSTCKIEAQRFIINMSAAQSKQYDAAKLRNNIGINKRNAKKKLAPVLKQIKCHTDSTETTEIIIRTRIIRIIMVPQFAGPHSFL